MISLVALFSWCTSVVALVVLVITSTQLAIFTSSQETSSSVLNKHGDKLFRDSYLYPALWNTCLMGLFILQHSGMATMWWKNVLADCKLYTISRAIYVISTSACLQVLMTYWQPLATSACVWHIDTSHRPGLWFFFFLLHLLAWLLLTTASVFMDPTEMAGVKQVYYEQKGKNIPLLYKTHEEQKLLKHMRHPGTVCLLLVLWLHPTMTLQRLLLSLAWSLYLVCGFSANRKDLTYVRHHRFFMSSVSRVVDYHRD